MLLLAQAALSLNAALAQTTGSYPHMAPIAEYRMAAPDEIALAKSALPPALAADADVMVLGARGYETAVHGKNGFVCMVERSWAVGIDNQEFWNPQTRGPMCFNPEAARSVMPAYVQRTEWVLAGASLGEIRARTRAHPGAAPAMGAMCYMLSNGGYLGDEAGGPWRPHLMFFMPRADSADWGANVEHSPVILPDMPWSDAYLTFLVPVSRWSDGTLDSRNQTH
jgi:hypothetical protein